MFFGPPIRPRPPRQGSSFIANMEGGCGRVKMEPFVLSAFLPLFKSHSCAKFEAHPCDEATLGLVEFFSCWHFGSFRVLEFRISEDCSSAGMGKFCPTRKSHEKGPNTVFLDRRGSRKSHGKAIIIAILIRKLWPATVTLLSGTHSAHKMMVMINVMSVMAMMLVMMMIILFLRHSFVVLCLVHDFRHTHLPDILNGIKIAFLFMLHISLPA